MNRILCLYLIILIIIVVLGVILTCKFSSAYNNQHVDFYNTKVAFVSGFVGPENGQYATSRVPMLIKGNNIDCYFVTNLQLVADDAKKKGWIVKIIPTPKDQSYNGCNLACKVPKVFPQKFTNHEKYDFIIWFDNKFDPIINELKPVLDNWDQNKCVAMHRHPFLSDKNGNGGVDKELKQSLRNKRYILQQKMYEKYINEEVAQGYHINGEKHYTCCIIIYNVKHPKTMVIQNTWMEHINRCGIQDQISMYFIAQRFKEEIFEFVGAGKCGGGNYEVLRIIKILKFIGNFITN